MNLRDIQRGGGGLVGGAARAGLHVLSWGWGLGSALAHLTRRPAQSLDVPVISVGNLAVGGTGKTPFVAWLAHRLLAAGRRPGILARGYGGQVAGSTLNDEGLVLAHVLGDTVPQMQDADRVRAGRRLRARHPEVDVLLLDDGFQHHRLARDLDIVLLDAMEPFGYGHLLPRGRLRESPRALRRAGAAVLTRIERAPAKDVEAAAMRIGTLCTGPVAHARSAPVPPAIKDELGGARVFAVCGIGNPDAFLGTLADLGADVVGRRLLADHAPLGEEGWREIVAQAGAKGAECVVTTRKDAVKVTALPPDVVVVDIETVIVASEDDLWSAVEAALAAGDTRRA